MLSLGPTMDGNYSIDHEESIFTHESGSQATSSKISVDDVHSEIREKKETSLDSSSNDELLDTLLLSHQIPGNAQRSERIASKIS